MKKTKSIFIITTMLAIIFLQSCISLTELNTEIIKKYELTEKDRLKKIQLYGSKNATILEKQLKDYKIKITQGKVIEQHGQKVDQIIIPPFTKGVVTKIEGVKLTVSFSKDDQRFLIFIPDASGDYVLETKKNKNGEQVVEYGGKGEDFEYVVVNSGGISLNREVLNENKKNISLEKGHELNGK